MLHLKVVAIVFSIELTFDEYQKIVAYDDASVKKDIDNFCDTLTAIHGVDDVDLTQGGHVEITVDIEVGSLKKIHEEILKFVKDVLNDASQSWPWGNFDKKL